MSSLINVLISKSWH